MKLLFISTTYPTPNRPHQGAFNRSMVQAFRNAGHDVRVVAPVPWTNAWPRTTANQRIASLTSHETPRKNNGCNELHPIYFYPPWVARASYHRFYYWSIRRPVSRLLKDFKPEFILGYWAHPDGQVAVEIARHCRVPGVVLVGGSDVHILAKTEPRRNAIQTSLRTADRIIAMSNDLREGVVELGIDARKISVVYRGVDLTVFSPGDRDLARQRLSLPLDPCILLWVGRLQEVKNPILFVKSIALLKESLPNLLAFMIGEGPLRTQIEREISKLDLTKTLKLMGSVPHFQLADWYRSSQRTVLTSDSEGVPNVLLESMACGTPFVASNVGGIPEIACKLQDRLVEPGNAVAFRDAVVDSLRIDTCVGRLFVPQCQSEFASRFMEAITKT